MKNLFIIDSPLQLINAIEAKAHFKTQNNVLLVIIYAAHTQRHKDQINRLISLSQWDEVHRLGGEGRSKYLQVVKMIFKLKKSVYKYLFLGHYATTQNTIVASLKKEELFLVDDGTLTLSLHKNLLNPKTPKPKETLKKKTRRLRFTLLGLKTEIPLNSINYFTMFDLTPHANESYVKNSFNFFKTQFLPNANKDNTVYLIGQNFIVCKELPEATYIKTLQDIKKQYIDQKIIYLPHREEVIDATFETLVDDHFEVVYFENSVEIEFLTTGIYPKHILGFTSTALVTLQQIFNESDIISYSIEDDYYQSIFSNRYAYFQQEGIKVLTI